MRCAARPRYDATRPTNRWLAHSPTGTHETGWSLRAGCTLHAKGVVAPHRPPDEWCRTLAQRCVAQRYRVDRSIEAPKKLLREHALLSVTHMYTTHACV